MKGDLSAALFASALGGGAQAADLATETAPPAPPAETSCFSSAWDFLHSSLKDCPLSYAGFTLFGNVDGGYGYEQWGAPIGPSADKPNYAIQRNSANTHWLWAPNALSTSVVGISMQEKLFDDWTLVGVAETGFNPSFGHADQRPAFAGRQQSEQDRLPDFEHRLEPRRPMGQFARFHRLQQPDLRNPDLRAHQRALARRARQI